MKHKFNLFDAVILERELPDSGLKPGTFGVVVELLPKNGVAVEFFDAEENSLDVALISSAYIRPESPTEFRARQAVEATLNKRHTATSAAAPRHD
jgi:hypothetical protein